MIILSIDDGISKGEGHCSIVLRPVDDTDNEIEYDSMYVEWSNTFDPLITELGFIASGIAQLGNEVIILGRLGQIIRIVNGEVYHENIQGPDDYGFLTDIKVIENSVVATGMSRQVYLRKDNKNWIRFDDGVLDNSIEVDKVTGFRSIDGCSITDIYAVGLEGEVWNYRDAVWREIVSPTNMILEQIKAVTPNDIYAVGQSGIILYGGGDKWEIVEQSITDDDFWGVEWFNNSIYITSATDIYKLNAEKELEIITPKEKGPQQFSRLRASQGVLWSFGYEKAFWTKDGNTWEEATIFSSGSLN